MTGTRVLTALVLVPVVVGIVLLAPTWVIAICVAAVVLVASREFFDLGVAAGLPGYPRWTLFVAVLLVYAQWARGSRWVLPWIEVESFAALVSPFRFPYELPVPISLIFLMGVAAAALADKRGVEQVLKAVTTSVGAFYILVVPLSDLIRLGSAPEVGRKLLLFLLVIVWVGDSAAYFVGRGLGRHKLAPTISPNKTWEGSAANLVVSVGVACVFAPFLPLAMWQLAGAGAVISIVGQVSDLLESTWKRSAGVKDSGALLPGHGGMLDRVDALILSTPAFVWYLSVLLLLEKF